MKKDFILDSIFNNKILCFIIISFLVLLSYFNIFANDFVMDDLDYIVNWPLIQDWKNLPKFFVGYVPPDGQDGIFSPLKTLFHACFYHLFKLNTFGHHAACIAIHLLAIFAVFKVVELLTKSLRIGLLSALIFALHPVNSGPTISMTATVDNIGIIFLLFSFFFYVKSSNETYFEINKHYVFSLILAVLGIFTHELIIILPVLFLWFDVVYNFKKDTKRILEIFFKTLPFFLTSFFYAFCKYITLGSVTRGTYLYNSFYLTMMVSIKALLKYVYICFFPVGLTHNHIISKGIFSFSQNDFDEYSVLSQSIIDPQTFIAIIIIALIFYWSYKMYFKDKLITFAVGWFFLSLAPSLNIIPSGVYFAERYLYLGLMGFCIILSIWLDSLINKKDLKTRRIVKMILMIFIIFSVVRNYYRTFDGRSDIAVYEAAVRANPQSALMKTELGLFYSQSERYDEALYILNESLKQKPNNEIAFFLMGDIYNTLGRPKQAIVMLEKAINLKPDFAEAYSNLAVLYAFWGYNDKADYAFNQAIYYYKEQNDIKKAEEFEERYLDYLEALK